MLDEIRGKIGEEIEQLADELNVFLPARIEKAVELGDLRQLGIERFGRTGFLEVARTGLGADSGPSQLVFVSGSSFGEFGLFSVFVLATQPFP